MSPFSHQQSLAKKKLIRDLQAFLWQFEQEGYSREAMVSTLKKFRVVLKEDSQGLDLSIYDHVCQMITDCDAYAKGVGSSIAVVQDLDRLRKDLEE